jgi:hypothetical protein
VSLAWLRSVVYLQSISFISFVTYCIALAWHGMAGTGVGAWATAYIPPSEIASWAWIPSFPFSSSCWWTLVQFGSSSVARMGKRRYDVTLNTFDHNI